MKVYQAFARTKNSTELINTEIKAKSLKEAKKWFQENTIEHERVFLK